MTKIVGSCAARNASRVMQRSSESRCATGVVACKRAWPRHERGSAFVCGLVLMLLRLRGDIGGEAVTRLEGSLGSCGRPAAAAVDGTVEGADAGGSRTATLLHGDKSRVQQRRLGCSSRRSTQAVMAALDAAAVSNGRLPLNVALVVRFLYLARAGGAEAKHY